jgi:hypothetical protein
MKLMTAYLDASALGSRFDVEFQEPAKRFFTLLEQGRFAAVVSDLLADELEGAPQAVKNLFAQVLRGGAVRVRTSEEAVALRDAYLAARVVTRQYGDDALHVALATVVKADVVASWNFRHLVNPVRIRGFNAVNISRGYGPIVILTPGDVVNALEAQDG